MRQSIEEIQSFSVCQIIVQSNFRIDEIELIFKREKVFILIHTTFISLSFIVDISVLNISKQFKLIDLIQSFCVSRNFILDGFVSIKFPIRIVIFNSFHPSYFTIMFVFVLIDSESSKYFPIT